MRYDRNSPLIVTVLDTLARDFVGDSNGLNTYFVSDEHGHVDTITFDLTTAVRRFRELASMRPLRICTLEDRYYGVLASVEPETDAPGAPLRIYDLYE